jgi:copper homeostasis protein
VIEASQGAEAVFHRAVDLTPDPRAAADELALLGFRRILTGGMTPRETAAALGLAPAAEAHAPLGARLGRLRALTAALADRIEVLAGGGVRAGNASELVRAGCRQLHSSCRPAGASALDRREVAALRDRLDREPGTLS